MALCLNQLKAARELCLERVAAGEGTVEGWGGEGATSLDTRQLAEDLQVCCTVVKAFETEVGGGGRLCGGWLWTAGWPAESCIYVLACTCSSGEGEQPGQRLPAECLFAAA